MSKDDKTEYYMTVQQRKSVKSTIKQHNQLYIIIPVALAQGLKLERGHVLRGVQNGSGTSLVLTKVPGKPKQNENASKMTYETWLSLVKEHTPIGTWKPAKTILEAVKGRNPPPAVWVNLAEHDIHLLRKRDKTQRTLWSRSPQETKPPATTKTTLRDATLTDIMEFK